MSSAQNLDPFDMWRQVVTKLEGGINSMANKSMGSEEFTRALQQFSQVSVGMQQTFEKALDNYFKALRLPNQKDIAAIADGVRRLEDKVEALLAQNEPAEGRPSRTRQPSSPAAAAAETVKTSPGGSV